MFCEDIPHRLALLLVDRGPSCHLVTLAGLERAAVLKLQVGNPAPDAFRGRAGIGKSADADHVAALLIIGIGIEEIVADVLDDVLDLAAGHGLQIGFRIGDGGLRQHILHRH